MSQFIEVLGNSPEGLCKVTRLWLKSFMQQWGEVIQIHKPPTSGDPKMDVATVRFARQEDAEGAVAFLRTGHAVLNGTPIRGDWKNAARGGRPSSGVLDYDANVEDSRSLLTKGQGQRRRSRSRSRGRGGPPPPRRDRSESRGRGGGGGRRAHSRGGGDDRRGHSRGGGGRGRSDSHGRSGGGRRGDSRRRDHTRVAPPPTYAPPSGGGHSKRASPRAHGSRSTSRRGRAGHRSHSDRGRTSRSGRGHSSGGQAPAPSSGLTREEKEELAALREAAAKEEAELKEVRRRLAARDAEISAMERAMVRSR